MLFCIYATDKPDALEIRLANRQAHLDYVKQHYNDKIICAGPRLADDGESMIGSLVVIDLPDEDAARAFCDHDPYKLAGVFADTQITRFKHVFPMKG